MRPATLSTFLFLALLVYCKTNAQQATIIENNNAAIFQLVDQYNRPLVLNNDAPDAEGSPFLSTDFSPADLVSVNKHVYKNLNVKFDLEHNEIYFKDSAGRVLVAMPGMVRQVRFTSLLSKEGAPLLFQSGYPLVDKQGSNYLYQLLEAGKLQLLKAYRKNLETYKNDLSGEVRKTFEERSNYYVFTGGEIKPLWYDKAFVLSLMRDKQSQIETYLSSNKINFKRLGDIQKLIHYYNTLAEEK